MDFHTNIKKYVLSTIGNWLGRGLREGWICFQAPLVDAWSQELRAQFKRLCQSMTPSAEPAREELTSPVNIGFTQFWDDMSELSETGDVIAQRWVSLDAHLNLAPEEIALLAVLVTIHYDLYILRTLRHAFSESSPGQPRWGFMTKLLADTFDTNNPAIALDPRRSVLFRSGIVSFADPDEPTLSGKELVIAPQAAEFLFCKEYADNSHLPLLDITEETDIDPIQAPVRHIQRLTPTPNAHVVIEGQTGSGKMPFAQHLARAFGCDGVTLVDLSADVSLEDAREHLQTAIALAVLKNDALAVHRVSRWCRRWEDGNISLAALLKAADCPVFWLVTGDVPEFIETAPEWHIRIAMPNRSQREALWTNLAWNFLSEKWIKQLAGQFLLTRGQMENAIRQALVKPCKGEALYRRVADAARVLSKEGIGRLAVPEPARIAMDQLIVSKECHTALQDLIMYARHRDALAREWRFGRIMPYGLGLAALFGGPPGTGKTFAAQVVATELGLELYRVDLPQLVSKYIGETEKHLSELFNAAEAGEILILFDEADSVFGKRTSVKSSVDRYANLEINYLLQRLERFSGVSILTSNFESGIDEAFMRRIRFKVPFEQPDKGMREILWNKFLSPAIPRSEDVDLGALAGLFEFSGGHIKEAVLRAASIAYGLADRRVTQDLLMSSAELEYKKIGKLLPYRVRGRDDRERWK